MFSRSSSFSVSPTRRNPCAATSREAAFGWTIILFPQDPSQLGCFQDAVKSIPHYIECCDYFWVCAPDALHRDLGEMRDFYSWKRRGWCRLEDLSNLMSATMKMPLILTSQPYLETYDFHAGLSSLHGRPEWSVGNGKFTCCHFEHRLRKGDGQSVDIPCDKNAIAPVGCLSGIACSHTMS